MNNLSNIGMLYIVIYILYSLGFILTVTGALLSEAISFGCGIICTMVSIFYLLFGIFSASEK